MVINSFISVFFFSFFFLTFLIATTFSKNVCNSLMIFQYRFPLNFPAETILHFLVCFKIILSKSLARFASVTWLLCWFRKPLNPMESDWFATDDWIWSSVKKSTQKCEFHIQFLRNLFNCDYFPFLTWKSSLEAYIESSWSHLFWRDKEIPRMKKKGKSALAFLSFCCSLGTVEQVQTLSSIAKPPRYKNFSLKSQKWFLLKRGISSLKHQCWWSTHCVPIKSKPMRHTWNLTTTLLFAVFDQFFL